MYIYIYNQKNIFNTHVSILCLALLADDMSAGALPQRQLDLVTVHTGGQLPQLLHLPLAVFSIPPVTVKNCLLAI